MNNTAGGEVRDTTTAKEKYRSHVEIEGRKKSKEKMQAENYSYLIHHIL
jgi:hypothetical protein